MNSFVVIVLNGSFHLETQERLHLNTTAHATVAAPLIRALLDCVARYKFINVYVCMSHTHMSYVTRHVSHVTCHMSHVTRHMSHVTCHTPRAHMSHVTYHDVTRHMSRITCHMSRAIRD